MQQTQLPPNLQGWVSFFRSVFFLISRIRLLGLSMLLFILMAFFTWLGYHYSVGFVDSLTASFFLEAPEKTSVTGWILYIGWLTLKYIYFFISRVTAFYLAFLIAYTVTSPGYSILSAVAEKIWAGKHFEADDGLTISGLIVDLFEAMKIVLFGLVVTVAALLVNFIPVFGQILAFCFYVYYSALMFLDYPASRRRWHLSEKIKWLWQHNGTGFVIGVFPALLSIIPVVNIFIIALLFPFITVYATLNFTNIEMQKKQKPSPQTGT